MFKPFSPQLRIAALAAGFLLILVGILMLRRGSIALGLLLILVGIAGYLWSSLQLQKQSPDPEDLNALKKALPLALPIFLSLACTFFVIYLLADPQPTANTHYLADHPYPWSGDEASIGLEGRRILNGEVTNFFDTGWSGQPNWSFVPTALSMRLFGEGILALRLG